MHRLLLLLCKVGCLWSHGWDQSKKRAASARYQRKLLSLKSYDEIEIRSKTFLPFLPIRKGWGDYPITFFDSTCLYANISANDRMQIFVEPFWNHNKNYFSVWSEGHPLIKFNTVIKSLQLKVIQVKSPEIQPFFCNLEDWYRFQPTVRD